MFADARRVDFVQMIRIYFFLCRFIPYRIYNPYRFAWISLSPPSLSSSISSRFGVATLVYFIAFHAQFFTNTSMFFFIESHTHRIFRQKITITSAEYIQNVQILQLQQINSMIIFWCAVAVSVCHCTILYF